MILETYAENIAELTLVPAHGGRFEVVVDGTVLFSKAALRRHADPNEVLAAIQRMEPVTA
jgi:predicted Rdx family selenoprotein